MGGFFLWSGIDAAINLSGTMSAFDHLGVPGAIWFAVATVLIETLGGIALVTNVQTRSAALVLVLFILFTAPFLTNFSDQTQMAMFFRNMAIVGGLLYLSAAREV